MPPALRNLSAKVYTKPTKATKPLEQTKLTRPKVKYGSKKASRVPRHVVNEEGQATVTQVWGEFLGEESAGEGNGIADGAVGEGLLHESPAWTQNQILGDVLYLGEEDDGSGEYGKTDKKKTRKRKDTVRIKEQQGKGKRKSTGDIEQPAKRIRKNRRKTEGDASPRKLELHTQTLTQWNRSFTAASEPDENPGQLSQELQREDRADFHNLEAENVAERSIYDVPSSSQSLQRPTNIRRFSTLETSAKISPRAETPVPTSEISLPITPRRFQGREIPSSQSPGTPLSVLSGSSRQHVLRDKSAATPIPFTPNARRSGPRGPEKLPILEVDDTFATTKGSELSRILTTPTKKSSPAKSVRFALAEDQESQELVALRSPSEGTGRQESTNAPRTEILDSDDEDGDDFADGTVTRDDLLYRESSPILGEGSVILAQESQHDDPETCYGGFGDDTQIEATNLVESSSKYSSQMLPSLPRHSPPRRHESVQTRPSGPKPMHHGDHEMDDGEECEEASPNEISEEKTQYLESQRLATQYFRAMAPRTTESDMFVSLPPTKVTQIVERTRDHDIRNWSLPPTVSRIWIYEHAPVHTLKYMAEIGPAKKPGQIEDEHGIENATFNSRNPATTWVAYEILQVYELADPRSWAEIKAKGWLSQYPKRYNMIPPGVLSELMANIKAPLFHDQEPEDPISSSTDTQEAEAQLFSTMQQFTQTAVPLNDICSKLPSPKEPPHLPPAFHKPSTPSKYPVASQATTVDYSQSQTPTHKTADEAVIWESPTRPIPSSSSVKLPYLSSRSGHSEHRAHEPIAPFSMGSSQILSRSQLLPDSLLVDSMAGPPLFVSDSDGEDEEL